MKIIIRASVVLLAAVIVSCSTSNPHTENCKIACERSGRKGTDMVDQCKKMCEKYDKSN
jgi:hypothetical protein